MIFLLKSSGVRWLQTGSAGVDDPVFGKLAAKDIQLTNSNATAIAISEFILASVLDVFHPNRERRAAQTAGDWQRLEFREISATTWAIVGLGNIGRETAIRAAAFGAKVVGVRRRPIGDEPVGSMVGPNALPRVLPQADVVVLSLALNSQSSRMVDRDFLAAMKPGSILINIARGGLVDEAALLASLDRGTPEWAILDVFDTEPLPPESPLWSHPRVRASGHCAAFGSGTQARGDLLFLDNLGRYLAGRPLRFVVAEAGM
jgi:phosphoglycerate dehydrogenase-like enzyme